MSCFSIFGCIWFSFRDTSVKSCVHCWQHQASLSHLSTYFHALLSIISTLWRYLIHTATGWHQVQSLRLIEKNAFFFFIILNLSPSSELNLQMNSWYFTHPSITAGWLVYLAETFNSIANVQTSKDGTILSECVVTAMTVRRNPQHDSWQTDVYSRD